MKSALWLMALQGLLGAFDTLYYHEWRARLPAGGARTRPELLLHAARDAVYALLFATLPFLAFHGALVLALVALLALEIVLTMTDFAVEARVRDVEPGERITHGVMAIVYGAFLALLVPELLRWSAEPTGFGRSTAQVPPELQTLLALMAGGVLASGVRDLAAASGVPGASFPWTRR